MLRPDGASTASLPQDAVERRAGEADRARPAPAAAGRAPYYAEEIRRTLVARYGEKAVLEGGMRVDIAMDPKLQAAADAAVRAGLEARRRRMGYRGALGQLDAARFASSGRWSSSASPRPARRKPGRGAAWRTSRGWPSHGSAAGDDDEGAEERPDATAEGEAAPIVQDEELARAVPLKPLREGVRLVGYVTQVDDAKKMRSVDLVGRTARARLRHRGLGPAAGVGKWTPAPASMSDVLKPGRAGARAHRASPRRQATGRGHARPGARGPGRAGGHRPGRPPRASRWPAATTSHAPRSTAPPRRKRQPGSSFKPFLYARGAREPALHAAISVVNDAPEAIRDPWTGKMWKPQNYEKGGFEGPMTLRQALTKSKNTVSVRLIEALTPAGGDRLRAPGGHPLRAAGQPHPGAGHRRGDDAGARQRLHDAADRLGSTPSRCSSCG